MRVLIHLPFSIVADAPAPENRLPFFIRRLQLQPHFKRVHCPAWEKVPHIPRPHHDFHIHVSPAPYRRIHASQRRRKRLRSSFRPARPTHFSFFSHRKRCRKLLPSVRNISFRLHARFFRRSNSKN